MLQIWGEGTQHKSGLFDTRNTQTVFLKDATVMKTITLISRTKPACLQMVFELPFHVETGNLTAIRSSIRHGTSSN